MSLGFGIVGTGMISRFHARALEEVRGANLIACCDRVAEAAQRFGKENQCDSYDDLKKMLKDERIDIISVCTPSGAHLEQAVGTGSQI